VYGWIWRKMPFGTLGRSIGSVLLVAATVALLWFVLFPAIEPALPFNDGQVTDSTGTPANGDDSQDQDAVIPDSPTPTR
jgi:hypothetical protein